MNQSQKSDIQNHIQQLTQFLLINELCKTNQPLQPPFNYSYTPFNKEKQKYQKQTHNVAAYLSPLFITTNTEESQGQESQERELKQCVRNSIFSESLQILLNNVLQMPKLRYQQSEKLFQVQTQKYPDKVSSINASKKFDFQTTSQVVKTSEKTDRSSNFPYAQSIAEQQTLKSGKKILDLNDSSYQEEMDIQVNMSARSSRRIIDNKSGKNFPSDQLGREAQNSRMMMKKQKGSQSHIVYLTQSQRMTKEQKNFIQNYFQSAKNQIMDHCSLNCCQGIFSKQKPLMNGMKGGLQLKKDQHY